MEVNFSKLPHTCSMIELSDPRFMDKWTTKKNLFYKLDNWLQEKNYASRHNKRYSLLYNCTSSDKKSYLLKMGFKEIASYKGDSNVSVLFLDVNKITKLTFWEWWNS